MRDRNARLCTVALLLSGCLGGLVAIWHARLARTSGLHGRYWSAADTSGSPALDVTDADLTYESVSRHQQGLRAGSLTAEWDGYLIVGSRGRYQFLVPSGVDVSMTLDRRLVADGTMPLGGPAVELTRGLHAVHVRLRCDAVPQDFRIEWSQDAGVFAAIPRLLFVPDLRYRGEIRVRRWLVSLRTVVPLIWLAASGAALGWVVRRTVVRRNRAASEPFTMWQWTFLGAIALLFITGAAWGVPDWRTWAADEVGAEDVLFAVHSRFSSGWSGLYPPLHFVVLGAAYLPFQAAAAVGLINLHELATISQMLLLGRTISVLMAVGTVVLVYRMAVEQFGRRAGALAAVVVALNLPLTYYSKTVNLDVPYVFWLALALLFYGRAFREGRPADFYFFTLAGVAAVCTKDQAYGFFVLPAAYLALGRFLPAPGDPRQRQPGVPTLPVFWRICALALVAFAGFQNLRFNVRGFVTHLRQMMVYQNFDTYPATLTGLAKLSGTALIQMGHAMSWPLFLAALLGIAAAFRARNRSALVLLLPVVSYHLFFICVAMYHYDRFFLGVIVVLGLFAGSFLDGWTRPAARHRPLRVACVAVALVYALSRCVALDALMVRDSRYEAERWLRAHVEPGQWVAGVGIGEYLPRVSVVSWKGMGADLSELESARPDWVIVNASFSRRFRPESTAGLFYEGLARGQTEYALAATFRTVFHLSPLNLEPRFRQVAEDGLSNLTKINPLIHIYERGRPAHRSAQGSSP